MVSPRPRKTEIPAYRSLRHSVGASMQSDWQKHMASPPLLPNVHCPYWTPIYIAGLLCLPQWQPLLLNFCFPRRSNSEFSLLPRETTALPGKNPCVWPEPFGDRCLALFQDLNQCDRDINGPRFRTALL